MPTDATYGNFFRARFLLFFQVVRTDSFLQSWHKESLTEKMAEKTNFVYSRCQLCNNVKIHANI